MPIQFKRNVFATGGSLRINLPSEIVEALEIKRGDTLLISLTDHQILMESYGFLGMSLSAFVRCSFRREVEKVSSRP